LINIKLVRYDIFGNVIFELDKFRDKLYSRYADVIQFVKERKRDVVTSYKDDLDRYIHLDCKSSTICVEPFNFNNDSTMISLKIIDYTNDELNVVTFIDGVHVRSCDNYSVLVQCSKKAFTQNIVKSIEKATAHLDLSHPSAIMLSLFNSDKEREQFYIKPDGLICSYLDSETLAISSIKTLDESTISVSLSNLGTFVIRK